MLRHILLISLPLFLLDFVTKEWTVKCFAPPSEVMHDGFNVIPGFFDLVRVHNTGVAFGMGNGGDYSNWIFGGISLTALCLVAFFWKKGAFPTKTSKWAAALLFSGIVGNLLDRVLRGYVVDFLSFYYKDKYFPAFNVADSCICVAAGLLFISSFQAEPKKAESEATQPTQT